MAEPRSERSFEAGFAAYQRGDLFGALILFEEAFVLDPGHEEALLNYARILRALGAGREESSGTLELVRRAAENRRTANGRPRHDGRAGAEDGRGGRRETSRRDQGDRAAGG